ncbi:MAG: N(4)-(beta-N-acetylglucosaminyl)-L-asparaginase [Phycisphaerae bacterium]|jgi:N4-(beta-N-acetylglucosaminyl)-L-asparaginase
MTISRREFTEAAALAAAGLGATMVAAAAQAQAAPALAAAGRTLAIASANGRRSVDKAVELIEKGEPPLDAVVAGVNIIEDDPTDRSVGYGGLPNEDGVVELDSCVMDGPTHKAGAVAALQRIKNPSSVAKLVMRRTDHVLLVGEGALRFARAHGFKEEDLLTDEARREWLKWKESHSDNDDWLDPEGQQQWGRTTPRDGILYTTGTVTCMAVTAAGDIAGCTSTSGLSYKLSGRVGDSPIIGAGLYVDNAVGACGSTGRGEANLQNCTSFLVVEMMRTGMSPEQACLEALRRVVAHSEPRLLESNGTPKFALTMYALRKDGQFGGASITRGATMAVRDGAASRLVELPALYERPSGT